MGNTLVEVRRVMRAPIEVAFEFLTDHEGMRRWPGVSSADLVETGEPRNGLGAVRKLTTSGVTIFEKVIQWEPPTRYDYTITKGLPVDHRGTVTLVPHAAGCEVQWQVRMSSRVPLLAQGIGLLLQRGLGQALDHAAKQIEKSASANP